MKISVEIKAERIGDLMCSAVEQNHMTRAWCGGVELVKSEATIPEAANWYCDVPALYEGEFALDVIEFDGDEEKTHRVTRDNLLKAFELMATKHGQHFGDFMQENDDGVTADVFLQLFAMGEVKYG